MPLIPSTTSEKPSNSETKVDHNMDYDTMSKKIEAAMDDAGASKGSSAAQETKAGVGQAASEVEKAANKLYEERMGDEYAKREGGA